MRFQVADFDPSRELVIDPAVAWKRCLGGAGGLTSGYDVAVTANGQAYLTGRTDAADFPTPSGLQKNKGVGYDVFVAKLRLDGSLERATFLDSGKSADYGLAVELDDSRNVYVAGHHAAPGEFFVPFITKLSPLLDSLFYARNFGGQEGGRLFGLAVDGAGRAVLVGTTASNDFCTTGILAGKCTLKTYPSGSDAFVISLDRWGNPSWATLLGAPRFDVARGVDLDSNGHVYVGGYRNPQPSLFTSWVTKLDAAGHHVHWSIDLNVPRTAQEPSSYAAIFDLEVDDLGNTHFVGYTNSPFLPVKNAVQPNYGGESDAFVGQVNNFGGGFVYLTYLGGPLNERGFGIAVGDNRHAYVVGNRYDQDADGDMFTARYSAGGISRVFYRKIGGRYGDYASGVDLDSARNMYIAGTTSSDDIGGACQIGGAGLPTQAGVVVKYLP